MKLKKDELDKRYYLYITKNSFIHIENEWRQLCGKWNWLNITFINISLERDFICQDIEFNFMLLGLGFRFVINKNLEKTEQGRELKKRIELVKDKYKK